MRRARRRCGGTGAAGRAAYDTGPGHDLAGHHGTDLVTRVGGSHRVHAPRGPGRGGRSPGAPRGQQAGSAASRGPVRPTSTPSETEQGRGGVHAINLAAGPELIGHPGVDFPDIHLNQSLRPDTARLAPMPISTRPLDPPMISIPHIEPASPDLPVPATHALPLTLTHA